jgi:sugar-specific transcriptional regulator TrmB
MDFLNIFNMDAGTLEEEYESVSKALRKLGLSEYEVKTYIALVTMDLGSAEAIGETAGIPRTSAYKVLQSLEEKGFVTSIQGRPTIFHPVPPLEIKMEIVEEVSEAFDKLNEVQGILSERGVPQLVFTIVGKEKVLAKIGEILDSSLSSFIISSPLIRVIRQVHGTKFREAVKRGVEVTIITEPFVKVPSNIKLHRRTGLLATDVFSDGEIALIATPDLSLCGFTDNPFLVEHLESFLRISMEQLGQN